MTDSPDASLVLTNRHTGEHLALRRIPRGDEIWLELRGSLPPRSAGPPLHVHVAEDEEGEVLAGTLSAVVDGRQVRAAAGERVSLPRGLAHRWWNADDAPLAFRGWARPVVDLDRYLQAIFEVMNAGPAGRPPLVYLAHAVWRHRRTQVVFVPPRAVQPLLLPLMVALGTLSGRYRGRDWPGCPDRCTGAPLHAEVP